MNVARLLAEHGSPLWLVDLDRVRERWRGFGDAFDACWPEVEIAYSYKTNRLPAILRTLAAEGAGHEVVCAAEYALARDAIGADGSRIVVNGPAKPDELLARAGHDGALVIADAPDELERAARAGVRRVGLLAAAARRARDLGLHVEALSAHLVSTGFDRPLAEAKRPGAAIVVHWPPEPDRHADAAGHLGALATQLGVDSVDLGGGLPAAPGVIGHARAIATALRSSGFVGRLVLEPGRAIVTDAVALACTVVGVKELADGARCVVADAGTNLLPGALWRPPRIDALDGGASAGPALVSGPLCLNVDVLHPAVELPRVAVGDALLVRDVGAYQQTQSTQFGELRPAVVAFDEGRWTSCARRETLEDLLAADAEAVLTAIGPPAGHEEEQP
jgi:diaminopimelate decarboxylase